MKPNEKGKQVPKKVGMAPIMRDGVEYEFTTVFDLDMNHQAMVSKDRTHMFVEKVFQISEKTGEKIANWLNANKETESVSLPIRVSDVVSGNGQ